MPCGTVPKLICPKVASDTELGPSSYTTSPMPGEVSLGEGEELRLVLGKQTQPRAPLLGVQVVTPKTHGLSGIPHQEEAG
jgi:hypothetical protein